MSYKVVVTSEFAKEAKRIAKKHSAIKADIAKLISDIANNPSCPKSLTSDDYACSLQLPQKQENPALQRG